MGWEVGARQFGTIGKIWFWRQKSLPWFFPLFLFFSPPTTTSLPFGTVCSAGLVPTRGQLLQHERFPRPFSCEKNSIYRFPFRNKEVFCHLSRSSVVVLWWLRSNSTLKLKRAVSCGDCGDCGEWLFGQIKRGLLGMEGGSGKDFDALAEVAATASKKHIRGILYAKQMVALQ